MDSYSPLEHQRLALDFFIEADNRDTLIDQLGHAERIQKDHPGNKINWLETFIQVEVRKNPNSSLNYGFVRDCTDDHVFVISNVEEKLQKRYDSRKHELEEELRERWLLL